MLKVQGNHNVRTSTQLQKDMEKALVESVSKAGRTLLESLSVNDFLKGGNSFDATVIAAAETTRSMDPDPEEEPKSDDPTTVSF